MRKHLILLMTILMLVFAVAAPAQALERRNGAHVHITLDETMDDDLITAGETITIDGTVNGDVIVFANTVLVNGTIRGNLIAVGAAVEIKGKVTGSIIAAMEQMQVDGQVVGSLLSMGDSLVVGQTGDIGHSWLAMGNRVEHLGTLGRGLLAGASRVKIEGRIGRELTTATDQLRIGPAAEVMGPVEYTSDSEAIIESGATTGQVKRLQPRTNWRFWGEERPWFTRLWWAAVKFGSFVVLGLCVLALTPRLRRRFPGLVLQKPWQTPLAGFLGLIALPVTAVILMATVIGLPLGILALVFYPIVMYVGQVFVAWTVGKLLAERVEPLSRLSWPMLFLVGALLSTLLVELPVVGFVASLASLLYGLGGLYFALTQRGETAA